ncbi:hypothetical protein CsSME_00002511 [Camellia sinensis var. sinensis]
MCYGQQRLVSKDDITTSWTRPPPTDAAVVEDLRLRLADTEARLERARAREADLSRRLDEMKRFVSVMEILETYLKRRFLRQQLDVARLFSPLTLMEVLRCYTSQATAGGFMCRIGVCSITDVELWTGRQRASVGLGLNCDS